MCDAGRPAREWRFYVSDMIEFCERVLSYSSGKSQDEFLADRIRYDATLRNLELIGEAATHVPSAVRTAHPDIPWRAIIGARNKLAHAYLFIDDEVIWSMVREAVPALLPALRRILAEAEEECR